MSFYNWIQKKNFNTYEEWYIKSPFYDRNGFHITIIDNSLKAMQRGLIMYTQISPPHPINGCESMKAIVSKDKNLINLYFNNKKYCIPNISYEDTHQIMRTFVQKSILPKEKTYMEIVEEEHNKKMMDSFVALVELLFKDSKLAKSFLNKINLKNIEDDTEELWFKLYNELLLKEKVIELDWKEEKDIFLYSVKELSAGTNLVIDEQLLDENQNIPIWSGKLNSLWTDYVLAAMELHCDTYVLLLLTKEDFIKAQELARTVLQRIAPAEEV